MFVDGDNIVIESGDVIEDQTFKLRGATGSLLLDGVSNVVLRGNTYRAERPSNTRDHLFVIRNSSNVLIEDSIFRCGATDTENILDITGSTGVRVFSGYTNGKSEVGVHLLGCSGCEFWDLDFDNCWTTVELLDSSDNWLLASALRGPRSGYSLKVYAGSKHNGIFKVRGRYNSACLMSEDPDNVFHHCLCEREEGYGAGWGNNTTQKEWGDPASLSPRWFTVFRPPSHQTWTGGDYQTLAEAMAAAQDGQRFLLDAGPPASEGNITVTAQNITIAENDEAQEGQYDYEATITNIHMPRSTVLRNVKVLGSVTYSD